MHPSLNHFSMLTPAGLSLSQSSVVQAHARALQQAAGSGRTQPLMRGKDLGLLCEAGDDADATFLGEAAMQLGAQVAHLRPSLSKLSTLEDIQHAAHVLGRLYDALACQGMPSPLIRQLASATGVPTYDGIASAGHPCTRLAEQPEGDAPPDDKRRYVLQALLPATMA